MELELSKIKTTRPHLRVGGNVEQLIESISAVGLINPLTVTPDFELLAGGRRYTALKALGFKKVPVAILKLGELESELVGIDENLVRLDLREREWSRQVARRQELYELRHPQTKHGGAPGNKGGGKGKIKDAKSASLIPSFAQDTATKVGVSERTIQQAIAREKKASESVKKAWEENQIGPAQVDVLIKVSPKDQDKLLPVIIGKDCMVIEQVVDRVRSGVEAEVVAEETAMVSDVMKLFTALRATVIKGRGLVTKVLNEKIMFNGIDGLELCAQCAGFKTELDQFLTFQKQPRKQGN